ncbi:MAG: OB-fold domain-containing protein [Sphingobium sp.]
MDSAEPQRMLPGLTEMNDYFWQGGKDGRLHILRCQSCATWIHPYAGRCPQCRSDKLAPEPVSGRATVAGFSVNHQPWVPGVPVPYVVAIVELEEHPDLRLMTNMPRVPIEEVRIGLPVKVHFEPQDGGIFLPLFEKA